MAYDGKVMRLALQRFEEDRQRRQAQYQERRERIFARQPRLREIDGELRSTMSRIITSALRHGTDPRSAVAVLRDENLSLQAEKRELLQKMGLPEDALEETPACALCGDTGYRNGRVCRCLRGYYAREQQKELSRMLDLGHQSFDTFSTDWYPDRYDPNIGITVRQHMEMIYDICADFAHQFGKRPANLLLFGAPGLGKTHLSAAIETAEAFNAMNPEYIGMLTLMVEPETPLYDWVRDGSFQLLTQPQVLEETRLLMEHLDSPGSVFRMNHASNYLVLKGTLNRDKEAMLRTIDAAEHDLSRLRPEEWRGL